MAVLPALAVAACGHADQTPTTRAAPPRPTLESELRQIVAAGSPGVIASVDDGHGLSLKASGVADTASRRALRPTDRFRAGSNTKTMVATLALQFVAERKLSLSDTVEHWLPGVLPYGDQVNLRQLLNMTSGVPDYVPGLEPKMVADHAALTRDYTPRELVAMVKDTPDFAPGAGWNYSTTGYILAGMMIERASGESVGEQLARRIFKPLGMRDTYLPGATPAIRGRHTHGYGDVGGTLRDVTDFNASAGWAGGGAVTTAPDMARFWRGLLGGKLLPAEQLQAMKTTVPIAKGYPGSYGLGIFRWTQYGPRCGAVWGNGGDLPGFSSEFLNSEDGRRHAGVIVNVNPIPKAVSGEPLGVAKRTAIANALGYDAC
ncbi:serine hydrolase domain-containing protein [Solirubrobacter soli]|uniref:serine hydrolase domain-containing protein n=1 Tax=Solirubrobacter soli TaxID=363832 RepID=UPI00146CDDA2|nr:serine hydrolase domain-containing protein [Solirubrobacter soli]